MSIERTIQSLSQLVALRAREVDRLTSELAQQQALRQRFQDNLERMEHLFATAASTDAGCPVLSSNSAHYKTSLVDLIGMHRRDLARHDADMETSRKALNQAALKHDGLDRALQDRRQLLDRQRHVREQKQQDQLATQAWSRKLPHARSGIHSPGGA